MFNKNSALRRVLPVGRGATRFAIGSHLVAIEPTASRTTQAEGSLPAPPDLANKAGLHVQKTSLFLINIGYVSLISLPLG
jgi:hypothetical protein